MSRDTLARRLDRVFEAQDKAVRMSDDERNSAQLRFDEVRRELMQSVLVRECFAVGSIVRSTALSSYSDIDLVAVIEGSGDAISEPRKALGTIADILSKLDAKTTVGSVAISLTFKTPPVADVTPALYASGGGEAHTLLIPADGSDSWQVSPFGRQDQLIRAGYARLGEPLKCLVRVLKYWNLNSEVGLLSSEIEELACIAFRAVNTLPSYLDAFIATLRQVRSWIASSEDASVSFPVQFRLVDERRKVLTRVQFAESAALEIKAAATRASVDAASIENQWRDTICGSKPAYLDRVNGDLP